MFGLSFGELMVLLVVAVVVLGPKELPGYLRKAGQFAGKLRRMAYEMREKSGIDEVLRTEGIDRDILEIRRLARGELGGVVTAVRSVGDAMRPGLTPLAARPNPPPPPGQAPAAVGQDASIAPAPAISDAAVPSPDAIAPPPPTPVPVVAADPYVATQVPEPITVDREREYPNDGADSYGALPDTALVYDGNLPSSPLAGDALYTRGEAA